MHQQVNIEQAPLARFDSGTEDAAWVGEYLACGGFGATSSTVCYFEIQPGKRLGWHHNSAEEVQFYVDGSGELALDGDSRPVRKGDVVVLPEGTAHDVRNTGDVNLRAIGFFARPEVRHVWSDVAYDEKTVTGTPDP
jgi:mannose-6-phosphate isomerase-like protein (cupin superfamily)